MNKIGIYINENLKEAIDIESIINNNTYLKNAELYCTKEQYSFMPDNISVIDENKDIECLMVFGGDGTILSAVDISLNINAPIIGINMGRLGFLTDFAMTDLNKYIQKLFDDEYKLYQRMMLETVVKRKGRIIYKGNALNDAVVYKGLVSRLINIKLNSSGKFVLETRCDGMIAATPTGSTAYSLSAGGPILPPEMEAFVVVALCPHVLAVRPMVFPSDETIVMKMAKVYNETMLQIDGKNVQPLIDDDTILIRKAKHKVSFITLTGKSFYQTLRRKLHMGKL